MPVRRRGLTAAIVLAVAATPAVVALAPAAHAVTAAAATTTSGFAPVTDLPAGEVVSLVSPRDGEVYVSGLTADGTPYVGRHADGAGAQLAVPGLRARDRVTLANDGTRTFAWTGRDLLRLDGATVTAVALPATVPGTTSGYTVRGIAAADGSLWVRAEVTDGATPARTVALRLQGDTWSATAPMTATTPATSTGVAAEGDSPFLSEETSAPYTTTTTWRRWDGAAWVDVAGGSRTSPDGSSVSTGWTFASATDYTVWGYQGQLTRLAPIVPASGQCTHVVGATGTPCPAPRWPVTASTRLADGRVVLGGADRIGSLDAAAPGAFAVVDGQDATPVEIPGSDDDQVTRLAAAPSGTTVWAVTSTGTAAPYGLRLQRAVLSPADTPAPAPAPSPAHFDPANAFLVRGLTGVDVDADRTRAGVFGAGVRADGTISAWWQGPSSGYEYTGPAFPTPIRGAGVTVRSATTGAYVLVHGADGAPDSLWLIGRSLDPVRVDLPATVPGTDAALPTSLALAVDGDDVHLTGRVAATGRPVVLHLHDGAWTASVAPVAADAVGRRTWVKDGVVYVTGTLGGRSVLARVAGDAWSWVTDTDGTTDEGTVAMTDLTPVSGQEATGWGHQVGTRAGGACVLLAATTSGCPAPEWPVSAATRLDDGRVVLGGADSAGGVAAPAGGGFALVPRPGAAPETVRGDNGTTVVRVVADPDGSSGAYALTQDGAGYHLLHSTLQP